MSANPKDRLRAYRDKRSAGATPEPFGSSGGAASTAGGVFVVQKHSATRLHYDFRLERDGVLLSWAVPRGPSLDPADKRMAIRTEDHPLDYSQFEGLIPEGNYGAGAVIVWDRGLWIPIDGEDDPEDGKLHFELRGYKLRGRFALVRTARKGQPPGAEWLLIKKQDAFAGSDIELDETSIYSGLTVEELARGGQRTAAIVERLQKLGAPRRGLDVADVDLMLCQPHKRAFSKPGWIFELKYDGYRLLASATDGRPALRYRRGMDATRLYPEVTRALSLLPYPSFVVDGEVVVFDDEGRTDFGRLQQRGMLSRRIDIDRATLAHPANLVAFDLLEFAGYDLRSLPLLARKHILRMVVPSTGPLRYADHVEEEGEAFSAKVEALHLEGIVGKNGSSTYQGRRSEDWRKIRFEFVDEFAVVGYSMSDKESRPQFRALQLAAREGDAWVYAGAVGSGFSETELAFLRDRLDHAHPAHYAFEGEADSGPSTWIEPAVVVQVRYLEWREGRHIRQPVFLAVVEDMDPLHCRRRRVGADEPAPEDLVANAEPPTRHVEVTNPDKLYWPADGFSKGDLVGYYRAVYPWLAPYLADRPLVLTRYPDGIDGKSFFQKDAPTWAPDWIHTETMWSEHGQRHIHYFVCDDEDSLVYLANLGTIVLHVWASRLASLQTPDWCILDLDPKGAPFEHVVRCALAIKELCDELGLPSYVKTSGSTGLHVLIPLGGACTYEQSKNLAHVIARIIEDEHRDIATTVRNPAKRDGKVYLDYVQNSHGRLLVAPYSVRPLPGAPVSMPLTWAEVVPTLDMRALNLTTAMSRLEHWSGDPLLPVLDGKPDLIAALERLERRMRG